MRATAASETRRRTFVVFNQETVHRSPRAGIHLRTITFHENASGFLMVRNLSYVYLQSQIEEMTCQPIPIGRRPTQWLGLWCLPPCYKMPVPLRPPEGSIGFRTLAKPLFLLCRIAPRLLPLPPRDVSPELLLSPSPEQFGNRAAINWAILFS